MKRRKAAPQQAPQVPGTNSPEGSPGRRWGKSA